MFISRGSLFDGDDYLHVDEMLREVLSGDAELESALDHSTQVYHSRISPCVLLEYSGVKVPHQH